MCLLCCTDWVFKYNSDLNKYLRSAHTVYLCVLCGSENKQRLLLYTALIDWFKKKKNRGGCVYYAVRTESLNIIQI